MRLTRLRASDVRCLVEIEIEPGEGLNFLVGSNGAGKSSLLEAVHLLAYGRSFRGRVRDGLIRSNAAALQVFVEWTEHSGVTRRAGLRHTGAQWEARLDGGPVDLLGELSAALAVLTFEPGSHALVDGPSEARRRFLDWGLFHVEQEFLGQWRRYARALKQRNAALKQAAPTSQLHAWEAELGDSGERITVARQRYVEDLRADLASAASRLSPDFGPLSMAFSAGWRDQHLSLADALLLSRERDLAAGFTTIGPHRATWGLVSPLWPAGELPSRGQAKLCALACLLAQGEHFQRSRAEAPIFLLDDFAAELDRRHQSRLLDLLQGNAWQAFITGTEAPQGPMSGSYAIFQVERGRIHPR